MGRGFIPIASLPFRTGFGWGAAVTHRELPCFDANEFHADGVGEFLFLRKLGGICRRGKQHENERENGILENPETDKTAAETRCGTKAHGQRRVSFPLALNPQPT